MKKDFYVYVTEDCRDESKELIEKIKVLSVPGCAVLVIGANPDIQKLKQEVNHVTSNDYKLFCLMLGNIEFDQGLMLQLGLAKVYGKDSGSVEKLIQDVKSSKPKSRLMSVALIAAAAVIAIAAVLLFVPSLTTSKETEEPAAEETTVAPDSEEILQLDDTYLKAFIGNGADKNSDGKISGDELEQLSSLDLSGLGISSLEPLLYAKNLTELNLSNNDITDITNLAALSKLEKINLEGNQITDYSVLDYLPNLKEIKK